MAKKTLLLIDHFPVENEFQIMLKLISTNSDWKQAVQIAINSGSMTVDGNRQPHPNVDLALKKR